LNFPVLVSILYLPASAVEFLYPTNMEVAVEIYLLSCIEGTGTSKWAADILKFSLPVSTWSPPDSALGFLDPENTRAAV
jgi:hypothetical protein